MCLGALLLCCSALPCFASCLVFFIAFLCFAVGTESEEENRKRSKGSLGGVQHESTSQNPPKMAPGSLPGGLWAPSGAEGGSQERSGVPPRVFLAPLGSLLAPLGALLGCSWRLLGRSGGVPGTLLGVILASLGCFLQGRLKNDPRSLKNQKKKT